MPRIERSATVVWEGNVARGEGRISAHTGAFTDLPYSLPTRIGQAEGKTSPEELLAAAHASCFSMAFSARLGKNGTPPTDLNVRAEVTFDQVDGGWKVTTSVLKVRAVVPGIDDETFRKLAEDARDNCPISKALTGNVELAVETTLVEESAATSAEPRGWQEGAS